MRLLLPALCALFLSACSTFTMTIPRSELQTDLSQRFPVEVDKHVVVIRMSDPQLDFPGLPDRAGLRMHVLADSTLVDVQGDVRVEGRIEYVQEEHAIYLRDPVVSELHLDPPQAEGGMERLLDRAMDRVASNREALHRAAQQAIEEALRHHPIYRLDASRSEKEAKAIRHLRSVHVQGDDLIVEVGL